MPIASISARQSPISSPPGSRRAISRCSPRTTSLKIAGDLAGYSKEAHPWPPSSLADEIKYIGPLTVAGIIVLSGGPVAAGIAALVGAGLGGAALKEILDRYTTSHTEEFAAALTAGAVLLWVRCTSGEQERRALALLRRPAGVTPTSTSGKPERPASRRRLGSTGRRGSRPRSPPVASRASALTRPRTVHYAGPGDYNLSDKAAAPPLLGAKL